MPTAEEKRDPRILKHIKAMVESGSDVKKYTTALQGIRDDSSLNQAQREAIYKTIAQEAALGYRFAVTGKPLEFPKPDAKKA